MIAPATASYLAALARRRLEEAVARRYGRPELVRTEVPPRPADPLLDTPGRLFVTWNDGPRLVGCLGQLEPVDTIERTVARLAMEAGVADPRTEGASPEALDRITGEISLLSEPRPLDAVGLAEIAARIRPGVDGVLLTCDGRRAFFLPQVWEQLPDPASFLVALARKGGMSLERAKRHARAAVFGAEIVEIPAPNG
ncbi:MAG: AmmeMemoRadiSam system protein A [Deltaproteobacteria bacterium]|nr:MAG: AmmeMemoRadiSam system protein A [Deltaproteobacteria bacterium]